MDSIIIPGEFNVKKITFSTPRVLDNGGKIIYVGYGGKPLQFQTPEMSAPFGLSKWVNNDGKSADKYHIDLSFKGKESRKSLEQFFESLQEFDKLLVKSALDNCQSWFKKKYASEDVVEALFTPSVKHAKDKATGEITDKYPPTFKIGLPYRDGRFDCEVYDKSKNLVDLNSIETKGSKISAIVRCMGIWIAGGKFGCSFKVVQMRVSPPSTIKGYAFKDLDEPSNNIDDEEDADDIGAVDPKEVFEHADLSEANAEATGDTVAADDDLVESSDDELEAAPKPIVAKKIIPKKK